MKEAPEPQKVTADANLAATQLMNHMFGRLPSNWEPDPKTEGKKYVYTGGVVTEIQYPPGTNMQEELASLRRTLNVIGKINPTNLLQLIVYANLGGDVDFEKLQGMGITATVKPCQEEVRISKEEYEGPEQGVAETRRDLGGIF